MFDLPFTRPIQRSILDLPLAAFASIWLLSFLLSSDKPASFLGSYGRWYDGSLAFFFFFAVSRILAEVLVLPKKIPSVEQGMKKWLFLSLPFLFFAAFLLFWNGSEFSYSTGLGAAGHTLAENPKNFLVGSGPATFFLDQARYGNVHSQVPLLGEIAATLGVFGFLFFSALWLVLAYGSLTLFQKREGRTLPSFLLAMVMACVVASAILPMSFPLLLLFWSTLCLGTAILRREQSYRFPYGMERFGTPFLLVLCLASIACGFFMIWRGEAAYRKSVSIESLQRAVQSNPLESIYRIALSRAYLERFVEESLEPSSLQNSDSLKESIQLATASALEATSLSPERAAAWEVLGAAYREIQSVSGARENAIRFFQRAVSLEPLNPGLHTELGAMYEANGDTQKAKQSIQKALALDPFFAPARIQEALLIEKEGKWEEAVGILQLLLSRSQDEEALVQLGRMYYNKKRYADAIAQFERALSLEGTNSNARYALALCYEAVGDNSRAIQELEKVLQLNPDNSEIKQKLNHLKSSQ
ncbi:MAG: tetratricopeptide repeat protein [bacterium]|nr:tetratricopeptide repeat protein [bacterium]